METCQKCGSVFEEYKTAEQIFSNGTKHISARCPECNSFVKYLKCLEYNLVGKNKADLE
jgi:RNase P subunit RPR2